MSGFFDGQGRTNPPATPSFGSEPKQMEVADEPPVRQTTNRQVAGRGFRRGVQIVRRRRKTCGERSPSEKEPFILTVMPVYLLSNDLVFPPPHLATDVGLLAVGGDLSRERLLLAYQMGIFPWYSENEPILWWSPDPRLVLYPREIHVSKTLKKVFKKDVFQITMDTAFERVIRACARVHDDADGGTWIVEDMIDAYCGLYRSGFAHSVEAWNEGRLVGGLYGVSLGRSFFGESMFSLVSNASSAALVTLAKYLEEQSFDMIDCQVTTTHLKNFGAREIPRQLFLEQLKESLSSPTITGKWRLDHKHEPR